MLNLGLFNLPGRELSMGLSLSYNSQKWEQKICSDGSGGTYVCGSIYTGGWRIANVFGSTLSTYWEQFDVDYFHFNAYWIDAMGTKHRYIYSGTTWPGPIFNGLTLDTIDGDRSKIVFDNNWSSNGRATLYMANGSTLYFDNQLPNKLTTANGNYLINSTNGSKLPAQDTLGRTVTYTARHDRLYCG